MKQQIRSAALHLDNVRCSTVADNGCLQEWLTRVEGQRYCHEQLAIHPGSNQSHFGSEFGFWLMLYRCGSRYEFGVAGVFSEVGQQISCSGYLFVRRRICNSDLDSEFWIPQQPVSALGSLLLLLEQLPSFSYCKSSDELLPRIADINAIPIYAPIIEIA